jgi:hypothetical protein
MVIPWFLIHYVIREARASDEPDELPAAPPRDETFNIRVFNCPCQYKYQNNLRKVLSRPKHEAGDEVVSDNTLFKFEAHPHSSYL